MARRTREYLTIGEVVEQLQPTFPDLSISKVRFLEDEQLITPERTAGGYRMFRPADVQRLELVLRLQKEHFMPLAVIRERLEDFDKGKLPPELKPAIESSEILSLPLEDAETVPVDRAPDMLGLPSAFIRELASFGIVTLVAGERGDELPGPDVRIAHTCWDLRRFGIEPRHMRMYETFAEREAAFFQQILMPAMRHRTPEARQKLVETLAELMRRTGELKEHMMRRAVSRTFEDVN
ncbi:MAG: MerR family transcriptional regulator [Coriobacteriia bacterium]|nr:MerR family transcriptional regulator [Coriobacteriia bacterium]MDZ4166549.1 MerR family transcriptional regulator [Coriobacteriia bacterium]